VRIIGTSLILLVPGLVFAELWWREEALQLALDRGWVWYFTKGYLAWAGCLLLLLVGAGFACAAFIRDVPSRWTPARQCLTALLACAGFLGALGAGAHMHGHPVLMGWDMKVVQIENGGRFGDATLVCYGTQEAVIRLHVRHHADEDWSLVEPPDYLTCAWPIEVRKNRTGARHLIVDSNAAAVALVDVEHGTILTGITHGLPSLDSLREEFGRDIRSVTDRPESAYLYADIRARAATGAPGLRHRFLKQLAMPRMMASMI
jgi:hypothetical protein